MKILTVIVSSITRKILYDVESFYKNISKIGSISFILRNVKKNYSLSDYLLDNFVAPIYY